MESERIYIINAKNQRLTLEIVSKFQILVDKKYKDIVFMYLDEKKIDKTGIKVIAILGSEFEHFKFVFSIECLGMEKIDIWTASQFNKYNISTVVDILLIWSIYTLFLFITNKILVNEIFDV
jgi:hypothetical protein